MICGGHLYSGCFKEISGEKFTYKVIGMQLTDIRHIYIYICVCVCHGEFNSSTPGNDIC